MMDLSDPRRVSRCLLGATCVWGAPALEAAPRPQGVLSFASSNRVFWTRKCAARGWTEWPPVPAFPNGPALA